MSWLNRPGWSKSLGLSLWLSVLTSASLSAQSIPTIKASIASEASTPVALANTLSAAQGEQAAIQGEQTISQLQQAQATLDTAQQLAAAIVAQARADAALIRDQAKAQAHIKADVPVDPSELLVELQNQPVQIEARKQTLAQIVAMIMPSHWRVLLDLEQEDLIQQRFDFVASQSRDNALMDLCTALGLTYRYFPAMRDQHGQASPLLVVKSLR